MIQLDADGPKSVGAVIGANVRRRREAAGVTQVELVDRVRGMGVVLHRARLVELEAGARAEIGMAEMLALAAALRCGLAELFEGDGWILIGPDGLLVAREQLREIYRGTSVETARFLLRKRGQPGLGELYLIVGSGEEFTSPLASSISENLGHSIAKTQLAERFPDASPTVVEWDQLRTVMDRLMPTPRDDARSAALEHVVERLVTDVAVVEDLAERLWGHHFDEEHRARMADADALPARSRGVRKGHVTRAMERELRAALEGRKGI